MKMDALSQRWMNSDRRTRLQKMAGASSSKRTRLNSSQESGPQANIISADDFIEIYNIARKAEASAAKAVSRAAKADAKADDARAKAIIAAEIAKYGRESYISQTPVELGANVKASAKADNLCVPPPVDEEIVDKLWGKENLERFAELENHTKNRILGKDFIKMLERVKWDMCKQKMVFTGKDREELNRQKQIDFSIHIKDRECLPCYITALVSLHSIPDPRRKSKQPKYNSKGPLGHAIRRATVVLHNAGPSRRKIIVGLTNLRSIQWFTVEKGVDEDAEYPYEGPYVYTHSPELKEVKRSLAAVLMAEPAHLLCKDGSEYAINGSPVEFISLLGSGATSTVYKANYLGSTVAAKVRKERFRSSDEHEVLRMLQGVPGIPTINGATDDGKVLLLSPVGNKIRKSVPENARRNLVGLIDTLRSTHEKGIVHRDVRLGNILVVHSSFLLVDWGFACKVGENLPFQGSLLTASSRVIECHEQGVSMVFDPADDLILFVKSLYLLGHGSFHDKLRCLRFSAPQGSSQEETDSAKLVDL